MEYQKAVDECATDGARLAGFRTEAEYTALIEMAGKCESTYKSEKITRSNNNMSLSVILRESGRTQLQTWLPLRKKHDGDGEDMLCRMQEGSARQE